MNMHQDRSQVITFSKLGLPVFTLVVLSTSEAMALWRHKNLYIIIIYYYYYIIYAVVA